MLHRVDRGGLARLSSASCRWVQQCGPKEGHAPPRRLDGWSESVRTIQYEHLLFFCRVCFVVVRQCIEKVDVRQVAGNLRGKAVWRHPQAIHDVLDESAKERAIDKRKVRAMRHEAGVKYLDFTPVMLVAGAMIVATRYVAMGMGDGTLYVMAGIGTALFLSLRFFMFKGLGDKLRKVCLYSK